MRCISSAVEAPVDAVIVFAVCRSALTRGRNENHLHTARTEVDVEIHHDPEPELGYTAVVRTFDRSRQRELAIHQRRLHELEPRRNERSVDQGRGVGVEL